jgi:biopolymer transport protein ExbD
MASFDAPERADAGSSKKRKRKRIGVHLDMTPMVDVAFLLLTFFMLTTVFSRPQAMEINLPETDAPVDIAQSKLLTLRVGADNQLYWNMAEDPPAAAGFDELHDIVVRQMAAVNGLVVLVKVDREADYTTTVDILDELAMADMTRFALAPMTTEDVDAIRAVGGVASPPPAPAAIPGAPTTGEPGAAAPAAPAP